MASVSSDDDNLSHKKKEKCQKRKKERERERERERLMRKQHQTVGWDYDYELGGAWWGWFSLYLTAKESNPLIITLQHNNPTALPNSL